MANIWLQERFPAFFEKLTACETEEAVKQVCETEVEAWRTERGLSESTIRNPQTATRKEIVARLDHSDIGMWALKHLNFDKAKWDELKAKSRETTDIRLESIQYIQKPDDIVDIATEMLNSPEWSDVACGLCVLTGRRLVEVLQTGAFERHTAYSVMFSGQAKKRKEFPAYEIPTLCESALVVAGLERLRSLKDVSALPRESVSRNNDKAVAKSVNLNFKGLIPMPEEKPINVHTLRAVYTRIAVLYYCPPLVYDLHFLSYTQGHFDVSDDNKILRSYASEMNYAHYALADANGNPDGRKGIRLTLPGVEVLGCFKESYHGVASTETPQNGIVKPVSRKREKKTAEAGTLTLEMLFFADAPLFSADVPEEAELLALVEEAMDATKQTDVKMFLISALRKEAKNRLGVLNRYAGKDFTTMSLENLKKVRDIGASSEHVRRAVAAIDAYNDRAENPVDRWFINPGSVVALTRGRFKFVSDYFKEHKEEIDAMNAKHGLTVRYNHKIVPTKIETVITLE
jgi:Telomere resolvase ResT/TelK catalytic domain